MADARVTTSLDFEGARALAQRIFEIYDKDRSGVIESYEIKHMLIDTYKSINKVSQSLQTLSNNREKGCQSSI